MRRTTASMRRHLFIAIGASAGAVARYGIGPAGAGTAAAVFPLHTLGINIAGSFLLAALLTAAFEVWEIDADIRFGLGTGLLGAFTTFSAFCRETIQLLEAGNPAMAALYTALSLFLGLAAAWLGMVLIRRLPVHREQEEI